MKVREVTKLIKKAGTDYKVIIEQDEQSFGAYLPDLPGCIAVGDSREEVLTLIEEAIVLHNTIDSNF